ncbi:hypothetical protein [uncultured Sulfitobacter sp.]|nr:hypothetical protein [uncultured Sulfitobacter sp.]
MAADTEAYEAWFRSEVQEALDDLSPAKTQEQVMRRVQVLIDEKHRMRV